MNGHGPTRRSPSASVARTRLLVVIHGHLLAAATALSLGCPSLVKDTALSALLLPCLEALDRTACLGAAQPVAAADSLRSPLNSISLGVLGLLSAIVASLASLSRLGSTRLPPGPIKAVETHRLWSSRISRSSSSLVVGPRHGTLRPSVVFFGLVGERRITRDSVIELPCVLATG